MSRQNIYRAAACVTAFSVAERFFGFVYRIVLSRTLGAEGMGLYQTALSVFAVLATAAASGLPLTVSRLITKYRAKNNPRAQQSVVAAALVCALAFSLPVFALLYFGHGWFDFLFSDPRCMSVLLVLLPALTFNAVYSVIRGVLWGNKQFVPYCVIDLIEELCMIGAGVLLVMNMTDVFDGARRVAAAVAASYLVSFTLAAVWFFAKGGRLRSPRRQLRPLLASALPLTGMRTSGALVNSAVSLLLPARLIAAGLTPQEAMGRIGVAMGMSMPVLAIPSTLIGSLALVMVPELAEHYFRGRHDRLKQDIEKAIRVTVLIVCLLTPPLFVLGEDAGVLLFSDIESGRIIRNSCFLLLPAGLCMISTGVLNSLGCEKQTCLYYLSGAAVTLACVWALPRFCGVYALTAGSAAGSAVTMALNLRLIGKKSKEKVCFAKHACLAALTMLPAVLFGSLLHGLLAALLPRAAAAVLCGAVLAAAQTLFLFALGLVRPRQLKLLVKRA